MSTIEQKLNTILEQQAEILRLLGSESHVVDIPCRYSARRDEANARLAMARERRSRRQN